MGVTEQLTLFSDNAEYDAFLGKFVPKKTTDDCYTPENIHEAVMGWVEAEYGLDQKRFIRPFWPGGDYQAEDYPDGCTVVDNPPFSLRAQIIDYYQSRGIRFFLYSPALTLLTRRRGVCHIAIGISVLFENGAEVAISFITNLENCTLRTAPALYKAIERANQENQRLQRKQLPKYLYPDEVVTAAIAQRWCKYGIDYRLPPEDCEFISALDAQRHEGKSIFGYGLLLSEKAAAERAAAERAALTRWTLSAREREIMRKLSKEEGRCRRPDEKGRARM